MATGNIERPVITDPVNARTFLELGFKNVTYSTSATRYFVFDVDHYFIRGIMFVSSGYEADRGMYIYAGDGPTMTLVPLLACTASSISFTTGFNYIQATISSRYRYFLFLQPNDMPLPVMQSSAPA